MAATPITMTMVISNKAPSAEGLRLRSATVNYQFLEVRRQGAIEIQFC
jgi:hypothetical protein